MKLAKEISIKIASGAVTARATATNDAISVPSPCISVCKMDERTGLCQGCLRSIDEIRRWGNADATNKRQIWAEIERRLVQFSA